MKPQYFYNDSAILKIESSKYVIRTEFFFNLSNDEKVRKKLVVTFSQKFLNKILKKSF